MAALNRELKSSKYDPSYGYFALPSSPFLSPVKLGIEARRIWDASLGSGILCRFLMLVISHCQTPDFAYIFTMCSHFYYVEVQDLLGKGVI